jgi:hypothetical protein
VVSVLLGDCWFVSRRDDEIMFTNFPHLITYVTIFCSAIFVAVVMWMNIMLCMGWMFRLPW